MDGSLSPSSSSLPLTDRQKKLNELLLTIVYEAKKAEAITAFSKAIGLTSRSDNIGQKYDDAWHSKEPLDLDQKPFATRDARTAFVKKILSGEVSIPAAAEGILSSDWDGTDSIGTAKITPERALGYLDQLRTDDRTIDTLPGGMLGLFRMILDMWVRALPFKKAS